MRTTLHAAYALLLACALLATAPALAQEPGGDAPDGVTAAQNADGQPVIVGDFEADGDVDCFAIYIDDPFAFSATTENSPDRTVDTNLYLFEGTPSGATTGEVFNDDTPATPDLLSTIPVGALPGPNEAGPGKYVICVTEYDVDPRNAAGEDIFPNTPFEAVLYPNAPSGDYNLASWNPTFIGNDIGPYQIDLTGIGNNPGQCALKLKGEIMVNPNPAQPGDILQITGRVGNNGDTRTRASLTIFYNRKNIDGQPGEPMGSLRFEGNVPPGNFPFKIRVRVSPRAPNGIYNLRFVLEDKMTEQTCGTFQSQLFIGPPTVAEGPTSTEAERVVAETKADQDTDHAPPVFSALSTSLEFVDAATSASSTATTIGVSPNPFASRTTISFDVDEATDVRLVVYDVLGREVAVLADGPVESGTHAATFDARGLAAGIYVYHLMVGNKVQTGRMTLAR